ncbi:helix-turn-helix transcriptional regulator [Brevibacillus laterosporus]|uniref:helix-turn-helix domain-containing protein n=1 Tax=Brevibacillus laterosporus TaxID=1465 RepID=UPI00215D4569|nr:helix-turn-helix transcriptional regulator [Brevibacillus laterosporus]MCR8997767.1 helix-turn-helix domain-containing protein [Brevibacillus laterosporus]
MVDSLTFTTLGELIRGKRAYTGLSLSELGRMTGISKGVLSKIENDETKRPELRTLKPIADVLDIPYEQIIEWYIKVEHRAEVFDDFLSLCIELSNPTLMAKVAIKFLENSKEDTFALLEHINKLANKTVNNEIRLSLYNTIIKYARIHGIPMYIAKSSLQKYLIERQDLKNMEESFKIGEEVVHYADFLTEEERIILYFRMALQAYAIKKYETCIELCQAGITLEKKDTELKARAYLAMINSYSDLGDYSTVELHLEIFKGFKHNFVAEATKLESAIVKSKKKEYDQAIPLLKESLQNISEHARIHVVNELLEIYFELKDVDSVSEIFANEKSLLFSTSTPYKLISLGRYYLFKGNYQVSMGLFEDGIISYTESLKAYGEVNAYQEIVKCMNEILSNHFLLSQSVLLFEKLKKVYNGIVDNKIN